MILFLRRVLHVWKMRRNFPLAVIHGGVAIGEECDLADYVTLFPLVALSKTLIGRYTYIQTRTTISNASIGPFCSIASDVTIGLAAHPVHMVSTNPVFYDNRQPLPRFFVQAPVYEGSIARTEIGADVWIGQGVMIKAGVTIGVGAVIGAGAIVTGDVAPYHIVAGCPAKTIKLRFSKALCARLLNSRWWELNEVDLERMSPQFADPEKFLALVEGLEQ